MKDLYSRPTKEFGYKAEDLDGCFADTLKFNSDVWCTYLNSNYPEKNRSSS